MKKIIVCMVVAVFAVVTFVSFGVGNSDNKELSTEERIAKVKSRLQKEYGEDVEVKLKDFESIQYPKLECETFAYSENRDFFPLTVHYWDGSGWSADSVNEDYADFFGGPVSLTNIYPTSITSFTKLEKSKFTQFNSYSKVKIYQDFDQIKAIIDRIESPDIPYHLRDYADETQEIKELIHGCKNYNDPDYGKKVLAKLSDRENLLVLDYGYIRVAISFFLKEVIEQSSNAKRIDLVSYHGNSSKLLSMLNNYGKDAKVLWKHADFSNIKNMPGMQ